MCISVDNFSRSFMEKKIGIPVAPSWGGYETQRQAHDEGPMNIYHMPPGLSFGLQGKGHVSGMKFCHTKKYEIGSQGLSATVEFRCKDLPEGWAHLAPLWGMGGTFC